MQKLKMDLDFIFLKINRRIALNNMESISYLCSNIKKEFIL